MAMIMPRDALVHINGNRLSDQDRDVVSKTPERIGNSVRTARGRLKRNHVANKWSFSVSYSRLPEADADTIDGFWGAQSIIDFYKSAPGSFTFSLTNSDDTTEDYEVVFEDFTYAVISRHSKYFYQLEFSVTEV